MLGRNIETKILMEKETVVSVTPHMIINTIGDLRWLTIDTIDPLDVHTDHSVDMLDLTGDHTVLMVIAGALLTEDIIQGEISEDGRPKA